MRIGILTQHFLKNYGGILQNWALQQVLIKLGHDPLTFEHDTCYSRTRWLVRTVKQIILTRSFTSLPVYPYRGRVGHKPFIDFIIKNIRSVTVNNFSPELEARYKCNAFIVGSDQVWRPAFNLGRLYNMFLDFASDQVQKIAYAASFGVSEWEYSAEETTQCRQLVQRFDAVSVREDSAVTLCGEYLGVDAVWVLDPTLLLDKEDYLALCKNVELSNNMVLVYTLHLTDDIVNFANEFALKKGLKVTILQAGEELKDTDCIETWMAAFRDADSVVTDSFHGMVFSIIFNKPFHIFKNESGGISRYESLMKQLKIGASVFCSKGNVPSTDFNWVAINNQREELKRQSLQFLIDSI